MRERTFYSYLAMSMAMIFILSVVVVGRPM